MDTGEKDWFAEEGIIQHGMIRIVHRYFAIVFRQITKFGIHPGQIPVLMLLVKKEGLSHHELHILIRNNEAFMMKGFTESEICLLNRFFEQIYQNLDKIPVSDLCDMCEKEEESDND